MNKRRKKRSVLRKAIWGLIIISTSWVIIFFFPNPKQTKDPFFENDKPLVIAHQGGAQLAPSSTLVAFENAAALGVDVIEFDVHMTMDGHLVTIHDDLVDRTTDGVGLVNEMTLEEVQALDAGSQFVDLTGKKSFRGQGVYIPTVEEVFDAIPDMRWNIEIKDTNDPDLYRLIAEKLWGIVQAYGLVDDVLFASFDHHIIELIQDVTDGEALVSGGRSEIKKFAILHKLFLNGLYRSSIDAIQIPMYEGNISLMDKNIFRGAKQAGMDVHFWTINDPKEMKELIDLGANGLITDRPDLMIELLQDK